MHHRKRAVVVSTNMGSEHRLPSRQIDPSLSPFSTADPKDDDIGAMGAGIFWWAARVDAEVCLSTHNEEQ